MCGGERGEGEERAPARGDTLFSSPVRLGVETDPTTTKTRSDEREMEKNNQPHKIRERELVGRVVLGIIR